MNANYRAMLIGSIGAGKSTLLDALLGRQVKTLKTQALNFEDWLVDTPGEYTENPFFYRSILATAQEVTHVLFVQDATHAKTIFPPNFASGFNKLPIGVVSKADAPIAQVDRAVKLVRQAIPRGAIVISSSFTGQGMQEIKDLVQQCATLEEMKTYCTRTAVRHLIFHP
ncbi:EutP/PduV family microcompartment system protein [Paenibacillus qinlingensis]|uniref:Ethanolamine utilization protein EutP n=1 Tax=Paenibacillus qinlingensis TaxID=1837343 RepID=A0ABU1NSW5_9BACL|nr:EutP/PduV family microcompartment system protein [Paenibacillus qinlingensis]MDR6550570.1 ethanolamine utilization protein EutP [Paenibacillus qinlingensis]